MKGQVSQQSLIVWSCRWLSTMEKSTETLEVMFSTMISQILEWLVAVTKSLVKSVALLMARTSTTVIREECSLFLMSKEKTVLLKPVKEKIQDSADKIQDLCMLLNRQLGNLVNLCIEKTLHCTNRKLILWTLEDTCLQVTSSNLTQRSLRSSTPNRMEMFNRDTNQLTNKEMTIKCMSLIRRMLLLLLITVCTIREVFIRRSIRMPSRVVKCLNKDQAHLLQAFLNHRVQEVVQNSLEDSLNPTILLCMEQCKNPQVLRRPVNKILIERVVV